MLKFAFIFCSSLLISLVRTIKSNFLDIAFNHKYSVKESNTTVLGSPWKLLSKANPSMSLVIKSSGNSKGNFCS
ncbi:hypothetical protein NW072_00495 [Mycoplasmopsis felis]|uniref:hypothetical protein n=1 Tax=Mycoplasmopsis felis TaxID=33923 RepID=UPI0021AF1098|nr:hypothetical protein [Mycoplasmopsis felis]UWV79696.1 hypothetical protein NW072_00495 [Mycoplasmopsis felis]